MKAPKKLFAYMPSLRLQLTRIQQPHSATISDEPHSSAVDTVLAAAKENLDLRLKDLGYPRGKNAALLKSLNHEKASMPSDELPARVEGALSALGAYAHCETFLGEGMVWEAALCAAIIHEVEYRANLLKIYEALNALV